MFSSNQSNAAAAAAVNYIEDMFSTYLYTGNGTTQTITNSIDLATYGGLVWQKDRTTGSTDGVVCDTARGVNAFLRTSGTYASVNNGGTDAVYAYNSNGFSTGSTNGFNINLSGDATVSWTFRKQPKFFDVVTYTGTGSNTTIAHSLGSVPGSIIVKRTDTTAAWAVYHRSLANTQYLVLNSTAAAATGATWWNSTTPTSSVFSLGTDATVNASGGTYVAYLFAHDAGGFGLAGTDNVISCGTFTTDGSGLATVTLGYEPQWTLQKRTDATGNWFISDVMREMTVSTAAQLLRPNLSSAESAGGTISPTATGFTVSGYNASSTTIYIAIRRGPMKVPTLGTSVFSPQLQTPPGGTYTMAGSSGFPIDWLITRRNTEVRDWYQTSRLTNNYMSPNTTAAEAVNAYNFALMQGVGASWDAFSTVSYAFRRAPSVFDVVCYTGTGTAGQTYTHNLGVVPELMIVKIRNQAGAAWAVYNAASGNTKVIRLNTTAAQTTSSAYWNNTTPTASVFTVGNDGDVNNTADTYVAYLFATCAGVSKVGSYTGTGTTLQINCGFTAGVRFVLIKRTDSTTDWYVWDSARGIVAGNDPYLLLNSTAAEVTSTDYIDTYSAGFEISSTAPAAINGSGTNFIFLAIA